VTARRIITFTTDFGHGSSYVGQMKGAALAIDPDLQLVDLCHEVPPQQVGTGSYLLESGYGAFPPGTIHVAVVDPGVGTARNALAVRAGDYLFLAPDNGLLGRVLERERLFEARLIAAEEFFGGPRSATFEGRDLFAPAAALLAGGLELHRLGPAVEEMIRLPRNNPSLVQGGAEQVPVLHIDDFGNVVLDIHRDALGAGLGGRLRLETPQTAIETFHRTYGEAPAGEPFLLINSAGYLEIALRDGSAASALGLGLGMSLLLTADV
jgi:S-adenosylmethionine hydrolase